MRKIDINQLISGFAIIFFVMVAYFMCMGTRNIPWVVIVTVVLVVQYVFVIPSLCKSYYIINQENAGLWRYIPLWNEIQMFSHNYAVVSSIATVACAALFCLRFLPSSVIGGIFGDRAGMMWGYSATVIFIIALVVTNFIYAFGLCSVMRNVNTISYEHLNVKTSKVEGIYYFMMMIPLLRLGSLLNLRDKVKILQFSNYGYKDDTKYVKMEG